MTAALFQRARAKLSEPRMFAILVLLNLTFLATFGSFTSIDQGAISTRYLTDADGPQLRDSVLLEKRARILGAKETVRPRSFEHFIYSSAYLDQLEYMNMALGNAASPPFRFRPLVPWLVSGTLKVVHLAAGAKRFASVDGYRQVTAVFWFWNFAFLLLGALLVAKTALHLGAEPSVAWLSSALFVGQLGVVQTAAFPMLDVASYCVAAAALYLLLTERYAWLALTLLAAPLVKESLIVFSPALVAHALERRKWPLAAFAALPLVSFAAVRIIAGFDVTNVQLGWNIGRGEFNSVYVRQHLLTLGGALEQLAAMAFAFGALWLYAPFALELKRLRVFGFVTVFVFLVIVAQILLSSRIVRVIAVATPMLLLIPALLSAAARRATPQP